MSKRTAHVKGTKEVISNLRLLHPRCGRAAGDGVKLAGEFLHARAQEIVPRDTGDLAANSRVRKIEGTRGFDTIVVVEYLQEYAIYVHENLEALHGAAYNAEYGGEGERLRGPRQQAKFLERPMSDKANQTVMKQIIKNAVQWELRK